MIFSYIDRAVFSTFIPSVIYVFKEDCPLSWRIGNFFWLLKSCLILLIFQEKGRKKLIKEKEKYDLY